MKAVLITGANGFIARHLAPVLKAASLRVVGVSRSGAPIDGFDAVYRGSLGDSLEPVFANETIHTVVHCANHEGRDAFEVNVRGTRAWLETARAHGAALQIFLSSLSAREDAGSDYGLAKYVLEQDFVGDNQVVFRLGIVVGDGGMFGRIKKALERFPLVPLLDNGRTRVYVLGIGFLSQVIRNCIENNQEELRGRVWKIQQPTAYTLRELMSAVRKQFGHSCWFIPVPSLPLLWAVSAIERFPFVKLPVSSTNLKGLRRNDQLESHSDFERFGYPEQSLDELLEDVFRGATAAKPERGRHSRLR